ncbi:MAG: type II toxin-antitoxin system PemK/MazF family toxin [Chloroflexi bacterium]|nr:type II toxin-antitoxin system PemK/MazF family toxin [Chloroflexota bacterium]
MLRGDIFWVDLEPTRGSEASDTRPAVLVSNDGANRRADQLGRGVVTVVPLTSEVSVVYPFQILVPPGRTGLRTRSKAQAEQLRAVDVERVGERIGRAPRDVLAQLDGAIRLHLGL